MKRRLGSRESRLQRDSNPRPRDPKSGAITARPRGRFTRLGEWDYQQSLRKLVKKCLTQSGKMNKLCMKFHHNAPINVFSHEGCGGDTL